MPRDIRPEATLFAAALRRFVQALKLGQATVVLGAGASAGLVPPWKALVRSLGPSDGRCPVDDADADQPAWVIERLLAPLAEEDRLARLRAVVYPSNDHSPSERRVRREAERRLRLIADLVSRCAAQAGWRRQFHAITFNIDDLLEQQLCKRGVSVAAITDSGRQEWRPTVTERDRARLVAARWTRRNPYRLPPQTPPEVRVFHAHGILTREDDLRHRSRDLVLSVSEYYRKDAEPYRLANLAQLQAFGSMHCLFFGFSFDDDAVRKLLNVTTSLDRGLTREKHLHTAFLQVPRRRTQEGTFLPEPDDGRVPLFRETVRWLGQNGVAVVPYSASDDLHATPLQFIRRALRISQLPGFVDRSRA